MDAHRSTAANWLRRALRRLWLPGVVALLSIAPAARAQDLHAAFEAAWSRQPAQRAHADRLAELDAKRRAAGALTPEPPSVALGQRTDQPGSRLGRRESDIELSAPLWLPGQRASARAVAEAEGDAYAAAQALAKWQLAGELRDAWWQARMAMEERDLAAARLASAAALAADVARRVKAGDLAKVDGNRASGEQQAAQIALGEADARVFRTAQQFSTLTGLARPAQGTEAEAEGVAAPERHPQRLMARQRAALAAKRFAYAGASRRDAPELSLGVTRERASLEERYGNSVALRLKVPFASDARNAPRLTEAQAARTEAEAQLEQENRRIDADIASARRDLEQARAALLLSASRSALSLETSVLLERAFKVGELDLPARLRAEAERFEAERLLVRARLDAARAISTLNQALGILP